MLKLNDSRLFTMDTAIRFAEQYKVPKTIWNEVWKRHLSGYDLEALAGYVLYKTDIRIKPRSIRLWIVKTEIYCRANHVMRMGVRVVSSEYFGVYEDFVIEEVVRNMKYSGTKDSRILV